MIQNAKALIAKRRSVRTFSSKELSEDVLASIGECVKGVTNPFGVDVEFRLLDAKKYGLSSPVIVGEKWYLAAKTKKGNELAYGYSFEYACLYALSLDVGSVMLGSSLSRSAFEKAMEVKDGEAMFVATPLGYIAEKMSIRETLMRKGVKADERYAFEKLFFEKDFDTPYKKDGEFQEAFEALRLAPSAVNKQPWRCVVDGDKVHFFEAKTLKAGALGDLQKVDMGIALCHFDLVMKESGVSGKFEQADPNLSLADSLEYIITYTKQ